MFLPVLKLTWIYGEAKHAMHEDCVVTHACPINCSSINAVSIHTYNDIPECPLYGEHHVSMAVQGVDVVLLIANGSIESVKSTKLHFYNDVETEE